ncbi:MULTISPECIES: glycosyltransferase family 2 protein [Actinoalloteichus]|uniref:Glycosyltransferase, GT2 family n=1 Tax=Actinoalloteichus caeruleus DSM 43889 TaxID=1120930 RepID=A0ABT1JL97_ACTCY|nr:glycosyltransferase family 2 protein [Actinoalloteichus caeruleus]MCP2333267.1 Glycosyltransferase, GT2 family [Actinoalloteichus caeruleus DSM 43889]
MHVGPDVLVAVVTHQSAEDLPGLLESLPAAMRGVGRWRLVIADNHSTDGTLDVARRLAPYAHLLPLGANLGYASGVNACAALATPAEGLLVLNADVRLDPGSVLPLAAACQPDSGAVIPTSSGPGGRGRSGDRARDEARGGVGVAAPAVRDGAGRPEPTMRRRPSPGRAWGEALLGGWAGRFPALGERIDPTGQEEPGWANGAVLFVPAHVRRRIGPWRADLFLYSEEVDYCRRVTDAGWRIARVPEATAVHLGGQVSSTPALWAQLVTNRVVHVARWDGRRAARLVWSALLVGQLVRIPLRRRVHRRALRELWAGRGRLLAGHPTHPAAGPDFGTHRRTTPWPLEVSR